MTVEICAETGQLAGPDCPTVRPEVFIAGTEPVAECDLQSQQAVGSGSRRKTMNMRIALMALLLSLSQPAVAPETLGHKAKIAKRR